MMYWNYYFLINILITLIFFFNDKKLNFIFYLTPIGFLFYLNFFYRDNLDVFNYYTLDLIYLLPTYAESLQNKYSSFLYSPYVNLFSQASTIEIISRNILLILKINNIHIYYIPFIFLITYTFFLSKFLKSFKLSRKIFIIVLITILFSKINLYQNYHSYRLYLGLGYVLFILSFYFKNYSKPRQELKTNFLLLFSLLFHVSLAIFILVFNLFLLLQKIKNKKFFINLIVLIFFYLSFYLLYKENTSEILFYNIPGSSYLLSKISWFGVHYTGTNSHLIYYIINPIIVGTIVGALNYINLTKKESQLELFVVSSLLLIILFSNNTFIWKRVLFMFFPFYVLIFYNYYDRIVAKLSNLKIFNRIDLSFIVVLNIFVLQLISDYLSLKLNSFYFVYIIITFIILRSINNLNTYKNYNILLFLPYLNISYISLLSLSFIELYR